MYISTWTIAAVMLVLIIGLIIAIQLKLSDEVKAVIGGCLAVVVALIVQRLVTAGFGKVSFTDYDGFAKANGGEYHKDVPDYRASGLIFDNGYNRLTTLYVFDGFEIGQHSYRTTGKLSGDELWHAYGYVRIQLGGWAPHIVLESVEANRDSMALELPDAYYTDQHVHLEGDFHKYFRVYAPNGYQVDARYILTPDVMATLINRAHRYSVELVDTSLYVYAQHGIDLGEPDQIEAALTAAEKIATEIVQQLRRYRDERVVQGTGDPSSPMIAGQGMRLRHESKEWWL